MRQARAALALAFVGGACGSDPCANGACECTVETEDADCGDHEYCDVTDDGRTCECVAGYTGTAAGCAWTGTIRDPGFEQQPSPWRPVAGAVLEPTAGGGIDPGQAGFPPAALCSLGHVDQTVDMPTYARAEPLVLELSYKNPMGPPDDYEHVLAGVSFGGGWSPLPYFDDTSFHTLRVCLPEGGYAARDTGGTGGPVTFAIGPYTPARDCPATTVAGFAIDHAAIVPANLGECGTVPGVGPNADAEGEGGWTFTVSGSSTGGFVAGAGQNGTRGAQIELALRCEVAAMTTSFNVPVVQNPALELYLHLGAGARGSAFVGEGVWRTDLLPGTAGRLRTCLPPSLRGQTMAVTFEVNAGSGACSDVLGHTLAADDLRVVDDPSCLSNANVSDPGFEHGGPPFGAFSQIGTATGAAAVVRSAPGLAHGGTRYLALEAYGRCSSSGIMMLPTVPAPAGAAGPALKFFASVGNNPEATTFVSASRESRQTLVEGGGYRPYTVCLDPRFAGRPQVVTIAHDGGAGTCNTTGYVQQNAFIDDLELTTDATCPAD